MLIKIHQYRVEVDAFLNHRLTRIYLTICCYLALILTFVGVLIEYIKSIMIMNLKVFSLSLIIMLFD